MAETKKTEAAAAAAPPEAACLTLRQKLVEMRKACPEIVKKQHSDGVSYKYAKIYDVWEKITPIMNELGVDFDVISEQATRHAENGDPVYWITMQTKTRNGDKLIPGTIPIDNSIHAAPAAGNKHAAAKNDGPKKEDNKTMTLEEMRAQHPDVVAQIEQQAAETARTQERARIEAIDSIAASVGDAQLVRDAKYGETPCTAEQLALKAMQKQAALGAKHLKDAKADNDESGAAGVGAAPNGGEEGSENDDKAKVDAIVGLYNSTKSQNGGKK